MCVCVCVYGMDSLTGLLAPPNTGNKPLFWSLFAGDASTKYKTELLNYNINDFFFLNDRMFLNVFKVLMVS